MTAVASGGCLAMGASVSTKTATGKQPSEQKPHLHRGKPPTEPWACRLLGEWLENALPCLYLRNFRESHRPQLHELEKKRHTGNTGPTRFNWKKKWVDKRVRIHPTT